jgi:hypothetical protein
MHPEQNTGLQKKCRAMLAKQLNHSISAALIVAGHY